MPPLTVTLRPLATADAWRLELAQPPRSLPPAILVRLDGRPRPFQTVGAPKDAWHPITLLWTGETGYAAEILAAIRAVATGMLEPAAAEAIIAAALTAWVRRWTQVQAWRARHPPR